MIRAGNLETVLKNLQEEVTRAFGVPPEALSAEVGTRMMYDTGERQVMVVTFEVTADTMPEERPRKKMEVVTKAKLI